MKHGYIYLTTNLINGRIYIGQTHGIFRPFYFGSGVAMREAIKKYGKCNFKVMVLAFANSQEMLDSLERKYISYYRNVFGKEFLYNIAEGGYVNFLPSESLKKISNALKGRVFSDEWKAKLSNAAKLRRLSIAHKEKISKSLLGNTRTLGMKFGVKPLTSKRLIGNKYALGNKHSQEFKSKFALAIKAAHDRGAYISMYKKRKLIGAAK